MTSEIERCYRSLDLEPGASLEQVKQAWRELAKVWHPDRFPNDPRLQSKAQERLKEINRAYEILEQFLASGTPPSFERSQSSSNKAQNPEQKRPEHQQTTSNRPSDFQAKASREPAFKLGILIAIVVLVIAFAILANLGNNSSSAPDSGSSVPGNGGTRENLTFTPAFTPAISKALDEKNGFKDFKFGMTPEQAGDVLVPTGTNSQPGANVTNFNYVATPVNRIGDFLVDSVSLSFFESHLYRVDLRFSGFQNEVFDAFKANYGEPFDSDTWKRGDQPLRAKAWQGNKVCAAVVALPGQLWDTAVIYDLELSKRAEEYASKEPERAAAAFGTNGFKDLVMGMNIKDVSLDFKITSDDTASGIKKVLFTSSEYWQYWQTIGYYPLNLVSAEFFHDRLYRIDLGFSENRKGIFEAFEHRFHSLADNDTWTRGTMKLKAKSANDGNLFVVILAPDDASGTGTEWDSIVLIDSALWREADQFKQDAPKRAAQDF